MFDHGVNASGAERARTARELFQKLAVLGETGHAGLRDLPAGSQLEAREVAAPERDQDQCFVVYAGGPAVATQGEFCDRIEPGEKGRHMFQEVRLGVQGETAAVLAINAQPPPANTGAAFPVRGVKELEDCGQTLVGDVGGVVAAASSVGEIDIAVTETVDVKNLTEVWLQRRDGGGR